MEYNELVKYIEKGPSFNGGISIEIYNKAAIRLKNIRKLAFFRGKPYSYYDKYTDKKLREKLSKIMAKNKSTECSITCLDLHLTKPDSPAFFLMIYFSKNIDSRKVPVLCLFDTGNTAAGAVLSESFINELKYKSEELVEYGVGNFENQPRIIKKAYVYAHYKSCRPTKISVVFMENGKNNYEGNIGMEWFIKSGAKLLL